MAARRHTTHPKAKPPSIDVQLLGEGGNLIASKLCIAGEDGWADFEVDGQQRVKRIRVRIRQQEG